MFCHKQQGKRKTRTFPWFAFSIYLSAVLSGNGLDNCRSEAVALFSMKSLF
jgi:hypothetical protein